jgi:hypothetical protein
MAQVTSVNLDQPTHADAQAKLAAMQAEVAAAETVTYEDRPARRTGARGR